MQGCYDVKVQFIPVATYHDDQNAISSIGSVARQCTVGNFQYAIDAAGNAREDGSGVTYAFLGEYYIESTPMVRSTIDIRLRPMNADIESMHHSALMETPNL